MGLFDLFSSSSSSSSTTQQTTQDQRVATDNGGLGVSGSNNTVTNQFSDNVYKAFTDLTDLAKGSIQFAAGTVALSGQNAADSLKAVTAAPNQVGADNATLLKAVPYIAVVLGLYVLSQYKGKL